jgi:hypothetical protein
MRFILVIGVLLLLAPAARAQSENSAAAQKPACNPGDNLCEMLRSDSPAQSKAGSGGTMTNSPASGGSGGGLGSHSGGGGGGIFKRGGGMVMDKEKL